MADVAAPEFEDSMHELVHLLEFASAEEREAYLQERYLVTRPWLRGRLDEARGGEGG